MNQNLYEIRNEIDDLDHELVRLLKRRYELVKKASEMKLDAKEGVFSKQREQTVVANTESYAAENQLPEGMMSDIMHRIMRESYKVCQNDDFKYPKTLNEDKDIVIVGGNGGMGRIFSRFFRASGYTVHSFGHSGWNRAEEYLKNAIAVIVTVPIDVTVEVIQKLSPLLREDQILCDFTSVKAPIVEAMMKYHKGPVLGLHPMFGPDVKSLVKQVIVTVPERDEQASAFLVEQFRLWGARIVRTDAAKHDSAMSIIQALRHFSTYAYGAFLSDLNEDLANLDELSSPIYHMELMMVGRLFAQDPRLYGDIIMSSDRNYSLIERFVNSLLGELKTIREKDLDGFTDRFLKAREYFGDFSLKSFKESGQILAKLQDDRN